MKYGKYAAQIIPAVALTAMAAFGFQQSKPILDAIDWTTAAAAEGDVAKEQMKKAKNAKGDYKDGTYTGTGTGYRGEVKVQVKVEKKQITDVTVLSNQDDASFFNRATALIDSIIEKQTWEVDSVSGATYSSRGIKEAVENALTGAKSTSSAAASASESAGGSVSESSYTKDGDWKDGTYTGTGTGFAGGTIKVQVVIKDAKIDSISIVSASNQDEPYFSNAKGIIDIIISAQSPNVDTVSGATYSSTGIKNAVIDALNQASGGSSGKSDKKPSNPNHNTNVPSNKKLSGDYNNGKYTGVGTGWGGDIKVRVTIKSNQITALKVVSAKDETPSFLNQAKGVLNSILKKQSTSVDVVTGATFSSNGIIEAVNNALKQAEKKTEPDPDPTPTPDPDPTPNPQRNGMYTGTATVYPDEDEDFEEYTLSVEVTFKDGKATAISEPTTSDSDKTNLSYCKQAYKKIAPKILSSQTTEGIDVVTSATCSSNALLEAYQDACKQADENVKKQEEENKKNDEDSNKKDDTDKDSQPAEEDKTKRNGTYSASATVEPDDDEEFDPYTLSLYVTFKNGETKAISGMTYTDSSMSSWCNQAYDGVVARILSTQSADVDTVSGATCSSRAIIAAYKSACAQADADLGGNG